MEKSKEQYSEMNTLMKELKQGREIANQLRNNLNPSLSTHQTREFLVQKLLSSLEKALSMLNIPDPNSFSTEIPVSPPSFAANCSPKSEVVCDNKDVSKRRKTMPRWSEQVRVCSSLGVEGPADDGYSWRKYGQKDILGANHPRGYYRCTHRPVQGCLATKQVQKSDQDPTIFEITYIGRHTCTRYSHFTPPKLSKVETELPKQAQQPIKKQEETQEKEKPQHPFPIFAGLTAKTEDLDNANIFPSFSFACTPEILDDHNIFSSSMHDDALMNNFISPSTSDSGYFSPSHVANFGMCQNSDSDLTEILSAPNSIANSPIGELDLTIESLDFDPSSLFSWMAG